MNSHLSHLASQARIDDFRRQAAHAALVADVRKPRRPLIHVKIRSGWLRARRPAAAAR